MKMSPLHITTSMVIFTLLTSCGNKVSNGNSALPQAQAEDEEHLPLDGSNIDGSYLATFITLNAHVNGTIPGSASFV